MSNIGKDDKLMLEKEKIAAGFEALIKKALELGINPADIEPVKKLMPANYTAEVQRLNEEVKSAGERALEAGKVKNRFLANMSHEIRTPMNSIIGFAEVLYGTGLNKDQSEILDYIKMSSHALLALINDILDYSKIEAGRLEVLNIEFDLAKVIWEVVGIVNIMLQQKKLKIDINIDYNIDFNVIGDPDRLRQVLLNLAVNAVKFTPKGRIEIRADLLSQSETEALIKLSVIDEGIGIKAENINKIFEPFCQADELVFRNYGGTGLGLPISNELAMIMGAEKINVTSCEGKGSVFYFTINFKKIINKKKEVASKKIRNIGEASKFKYNILLVEDNYSNAKLVSKILSINGHKVSLAENGRLALEAVEKASYDVILMDIQMPVMDGHEAAKKIRGMGLSTPIIAITANTFNGSCEQCIASGMNGFISKPINVHEFEPMIIDIVESGKTGAEKDAGTTTIRIKNPSSAPSQAEARHGEPFSGEACLDYQKLKLNLCGIEELMKDAVEMFIEYCPPYVADIKAAAAAGDPAALKKAAHKMKGTALNGGARKIAAMLVEIENIALGGSVEGCIQIIEKIVENIEEYKKEALKYGFY
ncbi:MAG: Sensory/regulatory protein RpfC [bacterium ADurb.Bin243]|mgnify:CR=1 FL=1|nr:MAG: Sensory/regulatory protein RpfC [bacterium ADurb.Bin243]HOD40984.1 response regulator [Candidatus Wallbacteria bacterium]